MANEKNYEAVKYGWKWSVLDKKTGTYSFIGKGQKFCELKAKELNSLDQQEA
ncbi:MAG: hypothetical protein IKX02_00390 [Spirochaetales bacterium]|nr:hypothetical protein [Spirochaetales bacterium]